MLQWGAGWQFHINVLLVENLMKQGDAASMTEKPVKSMCKLFHAKTPRETAFRQLITASDMSCGFKSHFDTLFNCWNCHGMKSDRTQQAYLTLLKHSGRKLCCPFWISTDSDLHCKLIWNRAGPYCSNALKQGSQRLKVPANPLFRLFIWFMFTRTEGALPPSSSELCIKHLHVQ